MSKLKNIDIEDYWSIINYNYDQIQFAEVKATAVISIYSLIFVSIDHKNYVLLE